MADKKKPAIPAAGEKGGKPAAPGAPTPAPAAGGVGAGGGGGGDRATPKPKGKGKAGATKAKAGGGDGGGDDDFDAWMKSRQLLKPDDQLELTEAELGEEITKVLTVTNTNVIHNLVVYSFKEGTFVKVPPDGNTVNVFSLSGTALHLESEEGRYQVEESGEMVYPLPAADYTVAEVEVGPMKTDMDEQEGEEEEEEGGIGDGLEKPSEYDDEAGEEEEEAGEGRETEAEADEGEAEGGEQAEESPDKVEAPVFVPQPKKRKLINQFNFCERAALTYTNPTRSVESQTIPPPRSQYGGNVLQWVIYDSYEEDYRRQLKEKEKRDEKKAARKEDTTVTAKVDLKKEMENELNVKYLKCWQILERQITQNIYKEIANDYRYWEDPADEFREAEGTLLPLWKFFYERNKKLNVTDIQFNPAYYDLFAVCFGSHDFMKQHSEGSLCLFTMKNPSYPDYIITTACGVMCCDIHPRYPFLVAIGLYDGNVAVYNLRENYKQPLYSSLGLQGKHADCVWEIKWGPDMMDGEINFYSVSCSGHVFNWVLMQNELMSTGIMTLFLKEGMIEGPDGTELPLMSCGSCMQFHPTDKDIYLIGTEEGLIYKCNIAYSSQYLMTYRAHNLSVYRIDFNRFNSQIFISCSGDWRVKIWEDMRAEPLFIFDLGSAVGDVKWAPYSSTVFAAVTNDGKVYVYDINVDKYQPICVQPVVPKRKNKLTRLAFNERLPIIVVGDDKGAVTSLKLSPNLRIMAKPPKKQLYLDQNTLQIQKLDRLLSLVREMPEQGEGKTSITVKS